jgi:hypothetical protein
MSELGTEMGRLLLFEPDPVKRHYFRKYVRGVIWRRLSEAERQERIAAIIRERRNRAHTVGPTTGTARRTRARRARRRRTRASSAVMSISREMSRGRSRSSCLHQTVFGIFLPHPA